MAASTIRKRPANSRRNKSGDTADRIDRRNKVLALRARGLSFREIAKLVGVSHVVCWRDFITLADGEETALTTELAKEQLLAAHAELIGKLMADLDQQAQQGQVEELRGPDGQLLNSKAKRWISPQTAAEAGRALQRVAVLMGLTEVNPDGQSAQNTTSTVVNLINPGDAASFQQRAAELAAARAEPQPITVESSHVQPEPASTPPEASAQPEPLQEPSEPLWRRNLAARRAAREAAQSQEQGNAPAAEPEAGQRGAERPSVRFLDPPQRN